MIGVIVWKEYREQRGFWLTLAAIVAAVLFGVPPALALAGPPREEVRENLAVIGVIFGWMYALISGAMLLAGERENGTEPFLESLPGRRAEVWLCKCLAGGVFVALFQTAVLVLIAASGLLTGGRLVLAAAGLAFAGVYGLGWGLLCSAYTRTVLGAIGLGIGLPVLAANLLVLALAPPLLLLSFAFDANLLAGPLLVLTGLALVCAPWPLSVWRYCRTDRRRVEAAAGGRPSRRNPLAAWRSSAWLAARQMKFFAAGLLLFCVPAGLVVAGQPLPLWPAFTLAAGVLCGVTAFLDEQAGPYRFLGEQRLPLTALWVTKVGLRFALLLLAGVVLLAPSLVAAFGRLGDVPPRPFAVRLFGSPLVGWNVPLGLLLFAPAATGFVLGHLNGLLFRKPLVAVVVGFAQAAMLLTLWVPSAVLGGLHAWQVLLGPLVLLAAARLLMNNWAAGRLVSWSTAGRLGGCVALCLAVEAFAVWYRVGEVPDAPEPEGLAAFEASLPTLEENEAGQLIRRGLSRVEMIDRDPLTSKATRPLFKDGPDGQLFFSFQAGEVVTRGWPDPAAGQEPELAGWLERVFKDEGWEQLAEAARKPLGVVEDPRRLTLVTPLRTAEPARLAGVLLAAHGLMRQKLRGDPETFVGHLDTALSLARNLENGAPRLPAATGRAVESLQLTALEHWLKELGDRPDLLRRCLEVLSRHRPFVPASDREERLAEYLVARQSLDDPQSWLAAQPGEWRAELGGPELIPTLSQVPWERVRQERLLRSLYANPEPHADPLYRHIRLLAPFGYPRRQASDPTHRRRLARLKAMRLVAALRLYQATNGRPAKELNDLVPAVLADVPPDPFGWVQRPFGYRLSKGEEIVWGEETVDVPDGGGAAPAGGAGPQGPPAGMGAGPQPVEPMGGMPGGPPAQMAREKKVRVKPGQGVVWSAGEDGEDNGGVRQGLTGAVSNSGEDLIFLVPLPKK